MVSRNVGWALSIVWLAACGSDDGDAKKPGGVDYANEEVTLSEELLVPAGKTVRVGPGAVFRAAQGVTVRVRGTLQVEGSAEAPAQFLGGGAPRSWQGIVVEQGGTLTLTHARVGDATYGIHTLPGADFTVTNSELFGSFKTAVIESEGSFDATLFKATRPETIAITEEVTIDDPNGSLTIMNASPSVTNCQFDGASAFTDLVRIGGDASPVFDRVYVHSAHCGFHASGGTNTSPRITNTVFENLAYGIMAYATKPIIEDSVFKNTSTDVGICTGATTDNTPVLRNNSYRSAAPALDADCDRIGTSDESPASVPNVSAGASL